jgi:Mce-associated membrane protein
MEGDAGASRLNPTYARDSSSEVTAEDSSESEVGADQTSTEVTAEDSSESEVGADQTSTEVTAEDSSESEVGADQTSTEVTAEAPETNAEDGDSPTQPAREPVIDADLASSAAERGPSRLGRRWFIGLTAALLLLAGGVGAGGYFALRAHLDSRTLARNDARAMQAAKECVAATQAPDTAAMSDSARKIIECATGDFGAQAALYSGLLVEAYQAANAHVQVSDMRAAVERNNDDGSVEVLVALRVKVTNTAAKEQESGYRLRVKMASDEGQYKIAKLEQVTK